MTSAATSSITRPSSAREQTYEQFAQQKRQVNVKEWVKVKLSNVSMFRDPKDELVVVTFEQDYQSNNLNNQMRKRQYWIREDGTWKIVSKEAHDHQSPSRSACRPPRPGP